MPRLIVSVTFLTIQPSSVLEITVDGEKCKAESQTEKKIISLSYIPLLKIWNIEIRVLEVRNLSGKYI